MSRHAVELTVFGTLFLGVSCLGLAASRWRPGGTLGQLDEWALGGRRFGAWVTWFLVGGDLYTAYTFVAIPALVFGAGAAGFFALPYTVIAFPLALRPLLRMWSVSRARGYVTPADFVAGRYGSSFLALLIAITGIVACMPYIALQLAGLEAVFRTMGLAGHGIRGDLPLVIAFAVVAGYTYKAGLRAPALIAFVKDALIYLTILVAVVYLPAKLGGWAHIISASQERLSATNPQTGAPRGSTLLGPSNQLQYATLAFGSALALFLYPHALTGVLAARSRSVIKRNMVALPAYSLLLGLLALLGYAALSAGTTPIVDGATGHPDTNTIIPVLFGGHFPAWFAGVAFAAIGVGALVPAAILAIAAGNLWSRNVYRAYLRRDATPPQEARQAKLASLAVKAGALVSILLIDPQFAVDLQLIGGVLILQTLPAVAVALYTRWLHRWALVAGWAAGMAWGLELLYGIPNPVTGSRHFGGSAVALERLTAWGWSPFPHSTQLVYVGFVALALNGAVAVVVTLVLRIAGVSNGSDETRPADYHADPEAAPAGRARERDALSTNPQPAMIRSTHTLP